MKNHLSTKASYSPDTTLVIIPRRRGKRGLKGGGIVNPPGHQYPIAQGETFSLGQGVGMAVWPGVSHGESMLNGVSASKRGLAFTA